MCKCLEQTELQVKDKILETLKSRGQQMNEFVDESEGGFQCKGLFFNTGDWQFVLPIEYKYTLQKKDGTPEKRTTKYKTNMLPNYCPMCGKKIERKN